MINDIFWFICKAPKNMGDLISPYLFEKITEEKARRVSHNNNKPFFLACGSILNYSSKNAIVWGTGSMFPNCRVAKPQQVLAVRGPLTRNILLKNGIPCPEVYGDPGLLLPLYYTPRPQQQHYRVGIIPHYVDYKHTKHTFGNIPGILVIDINRDVELVCDDIISCDVTISSSLHGIIVSHAYNVHCAWMTVSPKADSPIGGGKFKYNDYYLSREMPGIEPYIWSNLPLDTEKLYQVIDRFPQPKDNFDLEKLEESCPFGKL